VQLAGNASPEPMDFGPTVCCRHVGH